MQTKEVSKLSGLSAETLRYYKNEKLIDPKPGKGGYNDYKEADLQRLQQVMIFRSLGVGVKEISRIVNAPEYDPNVVLEIQIKMMKEEKQRLEKLIIFAETAKFTGTKIFDFKLLNRTGICEFIDATLDSPKTYELMENAKSMDEKQIEDMHFGMNLAFWGFGNEKDRNSADSEIAQSIAEVFIISLTKYLYQREPNLILSWAMALNGGGDFAKIADSIGGPGTAKFAAEALMVKFGFEAEAELMPMLKRLEKLKGRDVTDAEVKEAGEDFLVRLHRMFGKQPYFKKEFLTHCNNVISSMKKIEGVTPEDAKALDYALQVLNYYGPMEEY